MRKVHYVANSQFRHIFFRHALVYEYSDRSPTRALDQATATQSPRYVVLQAFAYKTAKTERTYKSTGQQQYSSTGIAA